MADLQVDSDGVRSAAAAAQNASSAPPTLSVTAPANDASSAAVAAWISGQLSQLHAAITHTNARAQAAGVHLSATASTYDAAETSNVQGLNLSSSGISAPVQAPSMAAPVMGPIAPPTSGGGVVPTSGKHAAQLIHNGPGTGSMEAASDSLRSLSSDLQDSAAQVASARGMARDSWQSAAADHADSTLGDIQTSFADHSTTAQGLSTFIDARVADYQRAKATIPRPDKFTAVEQRLKTAQQLNAAYGGAYAVPVAGLQSELAQTHTEAATHYGSYSANNATGTAEAGLNNAVDHEKHGPGAPGLPGADGQDVNTSGPAADPNQGGPLDQSGQQLMSTVVPAVVGGIAGAAGAILGAISGAGEKIGQLGSQVAGGLGQGASTLSSALNQPKLPGDQNDSSGSGGTGDFGGDGSGGGGGGMPGDTEPASAPSGPLTAPTAAASTIAEQGPPAYAAAAPAASSSGAPAGGGGMGGPMMPPMMGGRGNGSGGAEEDRLSPKQRLQVEAPANAEPVRGRIEKRRAKNDAGEQK